MRVHGSAHLEGIVQAVNYLTDDGHRIAIKVSFSLKASAPLWNPKTQRFTRDHWDLYHYALHYGTAARDTIFRYDLDKTHQHHVHIPPNTDAHVPCADVEPDVTDLDPRGFIEMVASFRKDKKQPVTRKHRPSRSRKKTP